MSIPKTRESTIMQPARNPNLIIDDISFRSAWMEKSLLMNISKLEQLADREALSAADLRRAIADLAADARRDIASLQAAAVERVLIRHGSSKLLPPVGLVPA
jgi:hypothetical protein